MARIQIKDLPPAAELTQEELDRIFGAGFSFRPSFESLENRELYAANIFAGFPLAPPAAVTAAATRELPAAWAEQISLAREAAAADQQTFALRDAGTLPAGQSVNAAREAIKGQVTQTLQDKFIGSKNGWYWDKVAFVAATNATANRVDVTAAVEFRDWGRISRQFHLYLSFANFGTAADGSQAWKLVENSHDKWFDTEWTGGWFAGRIDGAVRDAFAQGVRVPQFDPGTMGNPNQTNHSFGQNRVKDFLDQQVKGALNNGKLSGAWRDPWGATVQTWSGGRTETADGFTLGYHLETTGEHWSVDTNPAFQKYFKADLVVTMKYVGTVGGVDQYECTGIDVRNLSGTGVRDNGAERSIPAQVSDLGFRQQELDALKASVARVFAVNDGGALQARVNELVSKQLSALPKDQTFPGLTYVVESGALSEAPGGGGIRVAFAVALHDGAGRFVTRQHFTIDVRTGLGTGQALQVTVGEGGRDGAGVMTKETTAAFRSGLEAAFRGAVQATNPATWTATGTKLFAAAKTAVSGLGFTGFAPGMAEFKAADEVRVWFRATRPDGKEATYAVDFKLDRAGNFHAERAFLSARADVAVSDQEVAALDALGKVSGKVG